MLLPCVAKARFAVARGRECRNGLAVQPQDRGRNDDR